jgi:pilus assembly protein CpaB
MKPARIIVLLIALAAGGIAAFMASRSDQPPAPAPAAPIVQLETTDVLVANAEIGMGTTVKPEDLRWQTWPAAAANANFVRKSDRPDAIAQLAGSITRTPFSDGEPIREAKLIRADGSGFMAAILPTGMRAVSIDIAVDTGAGGFILPNDHVDVILSRRDRDAELINGGIEAHISETIMSNLRVLAIDQTVEEKSGQRVMTTPKTATLEVTQRQAERLALAHELGTLSLALRSLVDAGRQRQADASVPAADADSIVIYRGISPETFTCAPYCEHKTPARGTSDVVDPSVKDNQAAAPASARPTPK